MGAHLKNHYHPVRINPPSTLPRTKKYGENFQKIQPRQNFGAKRPKNCDLARSAQKFAVFRGEIGREAPENLSYLYPNFPVARVSSKIGPRSPLENRPKGAQNEPQEAPGPTMSSKRPKKAPKKGPQMVPQNELQEAQTRDQKGPGKEPTKGSKKGPKTGLVASLPRSLVASLLPV